MNALYLAEMLLACGTLFGFYRLFVGPNTLNRLLSLDYLCVCIISFICIYSIDKRIEEDIEILLIFSLIGFASVLSFIEVYFYKQQRGGDASKRINRRG